MRNPSAPASLPRIVGVTFALGIAVWSGAGLLAQIPGRNVNMVAGTEWPDGDPFLQRQNEPSIAASTRNPLHLAAGSNDYRTVDVPGLPDGVETGDAWVSVYKSYDGGQRWASTLMPGYPQDASAAGMASPLKGYQAAADPVVRAGTNGLIYYNGLVFDRGENGKSGIFLARFIDRNNKENGDPIAYLGASMVATSPDGAVFLDKPWMVVDVPRGNAGLCVVGGTPTGVTVKRSGHRRRGRGNGPPVGVDPGLQYVEAGAVYVGYTAIVGEGPTLQSQVFVKRSMDCGVTWSQAMRVSNAADQINQGVTLAISPQTGDLFAAWRRFSAPAQPDADAMMVSRLRINGKSFDAPGKARGLRRTGPVADALERIFEHRKKRRKNTSSTAVDQIDQGTGPFRFRTNAYPALAIDGTGRAYVAWSERGFAALRSDPVDGDARILVATTLDARTMSAPVVVDDQAQAGHQLMPSLAFAGGKLMLVFYDLRETAAQQFGPAVDDAVVTGPKRNTIDIRASLGTPGATPSFAPSVRVSDYLTGFTDTSSTEPKQLQFNPPNLPMFRLGTVPFIGDYIDVAPSPAFVPTTDGGWAFNTAAGSEFPVFHAVWTDNRDVRPPLDGNWQNYTPPLINGQQPGTSLFDPTKQVAFCQAGNAGSRNQNIYTARIGGGLVVGSPGNSKPLSPTVQRGFVVFAQNQTTVTKTFRMSILAQPPGGRASFEQFPRPPYTPSSPPPLTFVDVRVPARSTASRTVYATSTDSKAQIDVQVGEIAVVGGGTVPGGLAGRTVINPDIENPDIENPDIENPDIENPLIQNAEVYNPDIENPDIENPDIENPDIENPDIENPDIENPDIENPDIENIVVDNSTIANPDIENPDIENPDIENPDIENPDIENGTISDVTWTVTNIGNTTSAFNLNVFLAATGVPSGINTQLIVYKTYKTPVLALDGCSLKTETRNVVLFNVPSPNFVTPGQGLPDQNDPSEKNATLWLNPGEVGRVTLRIYDNDRSDNVIVTNPDGTTASVDPQFNPATVTTVGVSAQGVDVLDPLGATEPPAVTTTGTNLFFLQQPTNVAPSAFIAPPVRARIWDNTGAPLPDVTVSIALENPPAGVLLGGTTTAVTDEDGIATFDALAVNLPATGLRLRATASAAGSVAAGTSAPFDVVSAVLPATVVITNYSNIFTGDPKPVTVSTIPSELAVEVAYNGSPTVPSAIGAYTVTATVTEPGYMGSASAVLTIATTISAGGYGGGPYGPLSCGAGFSNGFRIDPTPYLPYNALLTGQLHCADESVTAQFGAGSTPSFDLLCPAGQNMVGFEGTTDGGSTLGYPVVRSIGPRCQLPTGGAITTIAPLPGGGLGTVAFDPIDCPAGQAVTGIVGGTGEVVDSIALVCAPVPPPTGPVSLWSAEGNALDSVGNHNGTLQGGTSFAPGRVGQAFVFNGTDASVDLGPWFTYQTFTVDMWVKADAIQNLFADIIDNNHTDYKGWVIQYQNTGLLFHWGTVEDPPLQPTCCINVSLTPGVWQHLAITRDGANMKRLYLDGVLIGSAQGPSGVVYDGSQFLRLGTHGGGGRFFTGSLDEVRVFDRALTPAEVLALSEAAPNITSVSPASGAAGEGFLVVRGTGLPPVAGSAAIVTNGATTSTGFIFSSPSTPAAYYVRLPGGFPLGPASIQIQNGAVASNAFPITVSATPGTPVIRALFLTDATPVPLDEPVVNYFIGQTAMWVGADGIDTSGSVLRFQLADEPLVFEDVPAGTAFSSDSLGLAVEFMIPLAFQTCGEYSISIRQGGSAFSAPVSIVTYC